MANPKMTRAHFKLIAEALWLVKPRCATDTPERRDQWKAQCVQMAAALAGTNPQFKRGRFLEACGVED